MLIKQLNYQVAKSARKVSLRTVLTVPFVLQIVATVGMVEYLSFKNGQQAVNQLAEGLMSEVSERVKDRLDVYLSVPKLSNQLNANALDTGALDIRNVATRGIFSQTIPSLSPFNLDRFWHSTRRNLWN